MVTVIHLFCKACHQEATIKWQKANPERLKAYQKGLRAKNRDRIRGAEEGEIRDMALNPSDHSQLITITKPSTSGACYAVPATWHCTP